MLIERGLERSDDNHAVTIGHQLVADYQRQMRASGESAALDADALNDIANEACSKTDDRADGQTVAVVLFEHYGVPVSGIV